MTEYNDPTGWGTILAVFAIFGFFFLLLFAAFYIIAALFLMRIFDKAGVQGKWRAWVPVYNSMVLGKLGDVSPWVTLGAWIASAVLSSVPAIGWIFSILAIVVSVMYNWRVGLKLGKDWYYLLLWLIPGVGFLIWLGILAFDGSRWNDRIPPAPWANSFIADKTQWDGIPVQAGAAAAPAAGYAAPGGYPPPAGGYTPPPAGSATPAAPTPPAPPAAQPSSEASAPSAEEPPATPRG